MNELKVPKWVYEDDTEGEERVKDTSTGAAATIINLAEIRKK